MGDGRRAGEIVALSTGGIHRQRSRGGSGAKREKLASSLRVTVLGSCPQNPGPALTPKQQ